MANNNSTDESICNPTIVVAGGNTSKTTLFTFNTASQLSLKLTGSSNYPTWKAQVTTLLYGYDLMGFIDGSYPCPPMLLQQNKDTTILNPEYKLWTRQDNLLRNAIMASVDATIAPTVASATFAQQAWVSLNTTYANDLHL